MESSPPSAAAEGPRNGGRRKNRGGGGNESAAEAKKKKTPQRGMGVAQLERLRLQADQRLKPPLNVNVTVPTILHHPSSIVFSPAAAVSGAAGLPAAAMINNGIVPLQFPVSHHDLYGFGGSNTNFPNLFNVGNVNENSKELSSTPNFTFNPSSLSDHHHLRCNLCHKKKRVNDGNLGYNQWVNIIGENQDYFSGFTTKPFLHVGYADKGVVAVQEKGSSSSSTGMKEYEFFPERNSVSQSCSQDDMVMMRHMMTPTPSESSSPVAAAMASSGEASFDASSSTTTIDLSLRLSY